MKIITHIINNQQVAEIISDEVLIGTVAEGFQLLVDLYYQNFDIILLHQKNLAADFFLLKTGMAGELLQKFSNFRVRLVILGDFSSYDSASLNNFIYESNQSNQVNFWSTTEAALLALTK